MKEEYLAKETQIISANINLSPTLILHFFVYQKNKILLTKDFISEIIIIFFLYLKPSSISYLTML